MSDDSDSFEEFISSIKRPSKVNKYRLSTGSLDDFIKKDSSYESSVDESFSPNVKSTELNKASKTSVTSNWISRTDKKNFKMHSVATPRRPIIFSSDSDDNVFLSAATNRRVQKISKSCTSKQTICIFTDSDKENDFTTDYIKPQKLTFLGDDGDDSSTTNTNLNERGWKHSTVSKPKPTLYTLNRSANQPENESDIDFSSLSERLSHLTTSHKEVDFSNSKRSVDSLPLTPVNNCVPTRFHTEKVNRQKKKVCSIQDCFLSSLSFFTSQNSGPKFQKSKSVLTKKLFDFYNSSIFDNLLPNALEITWSKRLTKTAGFTKCKRIRKTLTDPSGDLVSTCTYEAAITLSEKILDHAIRLRDTLIHELCHAAVWVLNNASESHGPLWKSWAAKARRVHPELPVIERCHNYDIQYKYKYQCTKCSTVIGRHSKSIDVSKKVCGICRGSLVLKNKSRPGGNPFSNFVKDNYNFTKAYMETSTSSVSHRDVMQSLSEQFKSVRLSESAAK